MAAQSPSPMTPWSLWQAARSGHRSAPFWLRRLRGAGAPPAPSSAPPSRLPPDRPPTPPRRGSNWTAPPRNGGRVARAVLKRSEAMAVRWSHAVIADNPEIRGPCPRPPMAATPGWGQIAAMASSMRKRPRPPTISDLALPPGYALATRGPSPPENNLATISRGLRPPMGRPRPPLGRRRQTPWQGDPQGRDLAAPGTASHGPPHIRLPRPPTTTPPAVCARSGTRAPSRSTSTVPFGPRGHDPSLVEMMGFGLPPSRPWDLRLQPRDHGQCQPPNFGQRPTACAP